MRLKKRRSKRYFFLGEISLGGLRFKEVAENPKDTMKIPTLLPSLLHTPLFQIFKFWISLGIVFVYSKFVYSSMTVYSLILLNHFIKGLTAGSCQLNIWPTRSFEFAMHCGKCKPLPSNTKLLIEIIKCECLCC